MIKLDIDRIELIAQLRHEFTYGKGVEIGTFKGEFARKILLNTNANLRLYMVDVWRGLGDEYQDSSNHNNHISAYSDTIKEIEGFGNMAVMIRADSQTASDLFIDESLDFVYIDANHAYDYVVEDIKLWYPKVKHGGYLMGHDYIAMDWYNDPNFMANGKDKHIYANNGFYFGVFGVNPAVDEFCKRGGYELTITNEWFGTWMIQK